MDPDRPHQLLKKRKATDPICSDDVPGAGVIQQLRRQLQEKDEALQQKDLLLQQKDVAIQQLRRQLQEKDEALQQRDAALAEVLQLWTDRMRYFHSHKFSDMSEASRNERSVVLHAMQSDSMEWKLSDIPTHLRDRSVVLFAIQTDNIECEWSDVPTHLRECRTIRLEAFKGGLVDLDAIEQTPDIWRQHFPFHVLSKLKERRRSESPTRSVTEFFDKIPEAIRNQPDSWTTWFEVGLPLLEGHPHELRGNRNVLLQIARIPYNYAFTRRSFELASLDLRNNVEFMEEVMKYDPDLFEYASPEVQRGNFDMAMLACSSSDFVDRYIVETNKYWIHLIRKRCAPARPVIDPQTVEAFRSRATARLAQHDVFVNPFLCGLASADPNSSALAMLNGKVEIKNLIGQFLGIGVRGQLDLKISHIRQALTNLTVAQARIQAEI